MLEMSLITYFSLHIFGKEIFLSVIPEELQILFEVIAAVFQSPL
ncbi:conserved hypothetical protein [Brochothrix thermosphacta]|nr:conserved hypothetical protein [Brochothrix thermosphacta]